MNGIDYIAQILKQEGVEWISCFPSNPLISAVARVGIRPVAFRHERGAVMAADGYSRISDRQKFGVCAMQAQAGAENAMGGIAQAYADNIPILVFLGGNNLDRLSVKPNFTAARNYQGWVKQVEAIYTPNQVGDVMLALGTSLTRSPYAQKIKPGKTIIHNTNNPDDLNKDEATDIGLVGDAKLTIQALIACIKAKTGGRGVGDRALIQAEVAAAKAEWMAKWTPVLTDDAEPLSYYRVIQALNDTLDPENSIVTHDAGAPRDTIVPFYTATTPHSYVGWGKTTHLGFGIPLIIGAKMAQPGKFCLNLMGDGAFGMSGADIETAARSGAAITTVLLNNSAMATYSGPTQGTIGKEAREAYGVSTMQGDYAKIAEGMGAVGLRVTKAAELGPALRQAQQLNAEGRTVLIDVKANVEDRRSRF